MKAIKNSQIIAKTLYYRSDGTGKIISSINFIQRP